MNVLGDGQQYVCRALAAEEDDKFAGIDFELSELGSPIIHGALAWIDCGLETVHETGDHYIVLGRVAASTSIMKAVH